MMKLSADHIDVLLNDFKSVLICDNVPLTDDGEYMRLNELRFLLRNIRESTNIQLYQSYKNQTLSYSDDTSQNKNAKESYTVANRSALLSQIQKLDRLLKELNSYIGHRLQLISHAVGGSGEEESLQRPLLPPRIIRLCDMYGLSTEEKDVFHLMVIIQGSSNSHVLNNLTEEDYYRRMSGLQRLARLSEVGVEIFCDPERMHVKEGMVLVDEENGTHFNLKTPRTVVQLLYGRNVRTDDLLKVSQTALEEVIAEEDEMFLEASQHQLPSHTLQHAKSRGQEQEMSNNRERDSSPLDEVLPNLAKRRRKSTTQAASSTSSEVALHRTFAERIASDFHIGMSDSSTSVDCGFYQIPYQTLDAVGNHQYSSHVGEASYNGVTNGISGGISMAYNGPHHTGATLSPLLKSRTYSSSASYRSRRTSSAVASSSHDILLRARAGVGGFTSPQTEDSGVNNSGYDDSFHGIDDTLPPTISGSNVGVVPAISSTHNINVTAALGESSLLLPYPQDTQLVYLEDYFQIIALLIRGNAARLKDDMKREGTKLSHWEAGMGGDMKHGARELAAKLRVQELKVDRRVAATLADGGVAPRLEVLSKRLHLDSFEKKMIVMLIGKTVSPVVKTLMETHLDGSMRIVDDVITVGQALAILCKDFQTQVANRKYFYKSGRLMKQGVISLTKSRWHQGSGDLTDNRVVLDRRVLDWVVGLDSEINELVEGSDLYEPKVSLQQVVLPPGHLDALLAQCKAYDGFKAFRASCTSVKDALSYGSSLVIMLCGKSGCGKTMTVNAIAKELKKKVLLVDFASLTGKKGENGGSDLDADLRGLFRESELNNAVLFFDECETIFKSRDSGGDRLLNSLLTEIERHEGIVFLATNRPYDLDEAMHRRITTVVEYRPPDIFMRKTIWQNLIHALANAHSNDNLVEHASSSTSSMPLDPIINKLGENGVTPSSSDYTLAFDSHIDIAAVAAKYELTGGFIKNAALSALLTAMSRDSLHPVVTQADLIAGCRLQMRGSMVRRAGSGYTRNPSTGLDQLELSDDMHKEIAVIIRYEKARCIVHGSWGHGGGNIVAGGTAVVALGTSVESTMRADSQKACIVALAGPSGAGKKTLAFALGYELGRTVRLLHAVDFMFENVLEAMKQLQAIVTDAQLADAMIVIDGFEHVLDETAASSGGESGAGWKLHVFLSRVLGLLYNFPGLVLLLCNIENPQNMSLQRDFACKLFAFVRIAVPPPIVRAKLWRLALPSKAPLASDISCQELGRRFEFYVGSIFAAVSRACAEAAMSPTVPTGAAVVVMGPAASTEGLAAVVASAPVLTQKHLLAAGEKEMAKMKSANFEMMSKLFT